VARERAATDMPEERVNINHVLEIVYLTESKVPAETLFYLWVEDHLVKSGSYDYDTGT
jgi:hypothetical protein